MAVEVAEFATRMSRRLGRGADGDVRSGAADTVPGTAGRCEFRVRAVRAGGLHGSRAGSNVPTRAVTAPFSYFTVATVLDGVMEWAAGREEVPSGPGDVIRYPTDAGVNADWEDFEVELIRSRWPLSNGSRTPGPGSPMCGSTR